MNETAETKICPFCAESIKTAAKKCPHCNSRQHRYAIFRQEFVLGLCCLIVLGEFVLACIWFFPDDSGSRYDFGWHRKDLETKEVKVVVRDEGTNKFYYDVSGLVSNRGNYPWRVQEIELAITNAQGVADVVHTRVADSFVVQPGTEHAFVFHQRTSLTNNVVTAQARVENARDGNAPKKDE